MKPTRDLTEPSITEPSRDFEEQVRVRAYELYENRGKAEGHAIEDWLQAEREIRGTKSFAGAA